MAAVMADSRPVDDGRLECKQSLYSLGAANNEEGSCAKGLSVEAAAVEESAVQQNTWGIQDFFAKLTMLGSVENRGRALAEQQLDEEFPVWLGDLDWAGTAYAAPLPGPSDQWADRDGDLKGITDLFGDAALMAAHSSISSLVVTQSALSEVKSAVSQAWRLTTGGSSASGPPRRAKSPDEPRQVFILYLDTGGGHRSAAQSLEAAFKKLYGTRVDVHLEEVCDRLPPPWCFAKEIYSFMGRNAALWERFWTADSREVDFRNSKLYQNIRWNSIKHIELFICEMLSREADLIVSVHPLSNHMLNDALLVVPEADRPPTATVVTDLGTAHLSWYDPRMSAVFVPNEQLRQLAEHYGFKDTQMHVCGLPLREGFWSPPAVSKEEYRQRLGLLPANMHVSEDSLVVLLMGGGEGFGALQLLAEAVGDMLSHTGLAQLVVACGRNETTRDALMKREWPESSFKPEILGFVGNIDEYMCASDVLITKAGPGSIAEAAIRGLPCLLTSFLPGQEEGNVQYVTAAGAGEFVSEDNPEKVAARLSEWLKDRELLSRMSVCARELGRPQATLEIARLVAEDCLGLTSEGPLEAECAKAG